MNKTLLLGRIDSLIAKGLDVLSRKKVNSYDSSSYVDRGEYSGFHSLCLSFIGSLFGDEHVYYKNFVYEVNNSHDYNIESGIGILKSIKFEIENDWLKSFRQLLAAEFYADFLQMAEHLLDEGYKDAAAVMIGSVLEEHLRKLCANYSIEVDQVKNGNPVPKKADLLNSELTKAQVYNSLEQKNVTAWLGIRNSAAHGKYGEYAPEQVRLMYQGVLNFVNSVN
jgi:hypothetical protein